MTQKIALVTGGNKGIGFEICKQLAKKDVTVILTARDEGRGILAQNKLKESGLNVHFHKLDVTNDSDVKEVVEYVIKEFGRLDILINNAGILLDYNLDSLESDLNKIKSTFDTNLFGPLRLCKSFIPLMKKNDFGRIVNFSSVLGCINDMKDSGPVGYKMSKLALNSLTMILSGELKNTNILVNSMCPGWVRTDMGGKDAQRSVEEGADTAVWLALDNKTSGKFFRDRKEIDW